jgi:hypothetical protein
MASKANPYGDGTARIKIVQRILEDAAFGPVAIHERPKSNKHERSRFRRLSVSIVLPTYKRAHVLPSAITSG